jgi:hypothetical protein
VWAVESHLWYQCQAIMSGELRTRGFASPVAHEYLMAFANELVRYGYQHASQISLLNQKVGYATSLRPGHAGDGMLLFGIPRIDYVWNQESTLMWAGYPAEFRDRVVGSWISEFDRTVRLVGRDYFINSTQELDPLIRDNRPGAPHATPPIRAHAGMIRFFQQQNASPAIVSTMQGLGEFLWPSDAGGALTNAWSTTSWIQ